MLLWIAFVNGVVSPWWPLLVWLAFGALVVVHARVLLKVDRARNAERVYLRGQDRLFGRWHGSGRDGAAYLDGHPYAHDLDLFGRASLFELINTTRTAAGETTLAEWLREGAAIPEVLARQAAVEELRSMLDFREDVAVLAGESSIGQTPFDRATRRGRPHLRRISSGTGSCAADVGGGHGRADRRSWSIQSKLARAGWLRGSPSSRCSGRSGGTGSAMRCTPCRHLNTIGPSLRHCSSAWNGNASRRRAFRRCGRR